MSATLLRRTDLGWWVGVLTLFACGSNGSGASSGRDGGAAGSGNASGGGAHASGGASDGTAGAGARGMPIVINELMPSNSKTVADDHGGYADWIELYNPTEKDVDLGGYYVSDKLDDPRRFRLPERLSLTAKGYLLLWADGNTGQGDSHLPFKLHKEGEAVVIAGPDGSFLDSVEFVDAQQDYAYARFPNEVGNFAWCSSATPGDANPEQCPSSSTGQNAGSSPPSDAGSD